MYTCSICQYGYTTSFNLARHMKLHIDKHAPVVERAPGAPGAPRAIDTSLYDKTLGQGLSLSQNSLVFQHPFTMTLTGSTGSGKTVFFLNVIRYKKKLTLCLIV